MDIESIHPVVAWVLVLSALVQTAIIWALVSSDILTSVTAWRGRSVELAVAFREVVIRYLTIPYLAALGPSLVLRFAFWSPVDFWDYLMALIQVWIGHVMWKEFKNRNRKHRIKEKVLSKVRQVGGKLVVVPVASRVSVTREASGVVRVA